MSCGTCKFFKDLGEFDNLRKAYGYIGECHGRSPSAMVKGVINDQLGSESRFVVWPIVHSDDFCGDYQIDDKTRTVCWQQAEEEFTKLSFWGKIKVFLDSLTVKASDY